MVTLTDIARAAHVSVDTVSRALRGKTKETWPGVAQKAERIRRIARELNYSPNRAAQIMRTKRTKQIGVLVWELNNPFTSQTIELIGKELTKRGYSLILSLMEDKSRKELATFASNLLDGILNLHPDVETSELRSLASGIPIVTFNRSRRESPALFPLKASVQLALNHLWKLGHRRIALLTGPDIGTPSQNRTNAYKEFYRMKRRIFAPHWIIQTGWRYEDGGLAAKAFLASGCTACLAGNDLLGIGLSAGLRDQGRKAPDDYSLMTMEDTFLAFLNWPPLTSLHLPVGELVNVSVEHLIAQIECREPEPFQTLRSKLIVRSSTGPVSVTDRRKYSPG